MLSVVTFLALSLEGATLPVITKGSLQDLQAWLLELV